MGFFDKIKQGLAKTKKSMTVQLNGMIASFTKANEDFYEELEETLIMADVGVETSLKIVERLRKAAKQEGYLKSLEIQEELGRIMIDILNVGDSCLKLNTKPSVILVIGVNGVGKTTTIGKLAMKFRQDGKKVLMCAGDTFRAAAAEQLTIWSERSGCSIVRHEEGSDPASVIFDGLSAAKAREMDIVICDTAGRLHNKSNLMNELQKIRRVIDREMPDADLEILLVLDATTGQNGLIQAKQFKEYAGITGIVLTKLDGTAKGGIVFAIADQLKIPVKYVGVGEKAEDLLEFNKEEFVEALLK